MTNLVKAFIYFFYSLVFVRIVIKCYFEEQNLNDKNKMALNDAGCHLHLVPNPYNKKERSDMIIIRDLLDVDYKSIVGLITSDGDFKPYLNQLQSKVKDLFVITNIVNTNN